MAVLSKMGRFSAVAWDDYICPMSHCKFESETGRSLLRHFENTHADDPGFLSDCLHTQNCVYQRNTFKTLSALKKHLYKFHGDFFVSQPTSSASHDQRNSFQEDQLDFIPPSPDQANNDQNDVVVESGRVTFSLFYCV
jgi:hypothetical protein